VVTSVNTEAELLAGIYQAPSKHRRDELRRLYEQLFLNIADLLPVTSPVAEQFARVLTGLAQKGRPIPVNDMWIAAIALSHDLILVSSDTHFQYVDGLQVEDWTKLTESEAQDKGKRS